jgi:hypothetical protein
MQGRRRGPPTPPWQPARLPPAGFCLEQDGGRFEAVQTTPPESPADRGVWQVTWRTACVRCGVMVLTTSTADGWATLRRRRCSNCLAAELEKLQAQREADGTP